MSSALLEYNNNPVLFKDKLKISQLKPYKNVLKVVYNNPDFKNACKSESNITILKMLAYLETLREKSQELVKEILTDVHGNDSKIKEDDIKVFTNQFINNNIETVRRLSMLPLELQPSRESLETLTKLSFGNNISCN